jgi:hypothetical protein
MVHAILIIAAMLLPVQEAVRLSQDGRTFELTTSGKRFVPVGANYAPRNLVLEDHWDSHWDEIEGDLAEMREMGMNVARIHLQFDRFMRDANTPNEHSLKMLKRLVAAAEQRGLYLDITGLACYRPMYVPLWYDELGERERWDAQARFWEAVAGACSGSNAIFCYDLINEPLVPGEARKPGQWYSGVLFGGFDFLQFISLDPAGRERSQVARAWIDHMVAAIRRADPRTMITVGLLPTTPEGAHFSGFEPAAIAPGLDFISVHIYPETGRTTVALQQLRAVDAGKPIVIEETFPLSCSLADLETFLADASTTAAGVLGHYWGEPPGLLRELRDAGKATMSQALTLEWLELTMRIRPNPEKAGNAYRVVPKGEEP